MTSKLVEMVKPNITTSNEIIGNITNLNETAASTTSTSILTTQLPETSTLAIDNEKTSPSSKFDWDENQKQLILGSFFWGYILTELPGGRLAELIGGHRVFGHSMFWASVITLITPVTAHMGFEAMVVLRAVLGFMLGGE